MEEMASNDNFRAFHAATGDSCPQRQTAVGTTASRRRRPEKIAGGALGRE